MKEEEVIADLRVLGMQQFPCRTKKKRHQISAGAATWD
jgi:hypothetical protein